MAGAMAAGEGQAGRATLAAIARARVELQPAVAFCLGYPEIRLLQNVPWKTPAEILDGAYFRTFC